MGRHEMAIEANPQISDLLEQHQQDLYRKETEIADLRASYKSLLDRLTRHQSQLDQELEQAYHAQNEAYQQLRLESGLLKISYERQQERFQQSQQALVQTKDQLEAAEVDNRQLNKQLKTLKGVESASRGFLSNWPKNYSKRF